MWIFLHRVDDASTPRSRHGVSFRPGRVYTQCGLDIVDTNGRADDRGPAEDYLRYFTDHFTDDEWETIKR